MYVGTFFKLSEFTHSDTARVLSLRNVPTDAQIENIKRLCAVVLDPLRKYVGVPVIITSGYRSELLNTAVGGTRRSKHMFGLAADIKCSQTTKALAFLEDMREKGILKELIYYRERNFIHCAI